MSTNNVMFSWRNKKNINTSGLKKSIFSRTMVNMVTFFFHVNSTNKAYHNNTYHRTR